MFDLNLSQEQIEFRDTVRDFVQNEVKPAAIHPARLEPFEKPLLEALLGDASRMGLRTLTLSEAHGGASADTLTSCIVLEELACGDVDIATVLGVTQGIARSLESALSTPQRERFFCELQEDDAFHLALAGEARPVGGWHYHRDEREERNGPLAVRDTNGDWVLSGTTGFVANARLAKLFIVQSRTEREGRTSPLTLLVPRDASGLVILDPPLERDAAGALRTSAWHHGAGAQVSFENCRVPAANQVGADGQSTFPHALHDVRATVHTAAVNLGLGRSAYEAAVEYAKIRIQGGRPIIQHQAIGAILADLAIKIELARSIVWKAAWAADYPASDGNASALPLHTMARVYTAEAVHDIAVRAAECFGAMGVMRDMPLQKYVHDAHVFLYSADHDSATKLEIAEALAGFDREVA